jgi:hypothetical protein
MLTFSTVEDIPRRIMTSHADASQQLRPRPHFGGPGARNCAGALVGGCGAVAVRGCLFSRPGAILAPNRCSGPAGRPAAFLAVILNAEEFSEHPDPVEFRQRPICPAGKSAGEYLEGGRQVGDAGFFFEATVVTQVRQSDSIVQDETFGPVITVQSFGSEEEAVTMANDVRYALASSVWTRDHARALRVSRDLDFGAVWINTHILLTAEMPHGGFKYSGYGKDLSMYGVEDYTRIKHVMSSLE